MEKPYGRHSPDRRVLGLVNNNNIYNPTDNLDLLTNVASELAESADRARKLGLQTKSSSRRSSDFKPRKDKSLGILCDKFLAMFPLTLEDDCQSLEISLDRVANQLEIVKRRIYDIINILESLHMTARVAKNRYEWHGNRHLKPVLTHLKRLALQYGLDAKMREVQVQQKSLQSKNASTTVPFTCGCSDSSQTPSSSLPFDSENFFHDERTLGIMCQKFIMLFLVTDPGHSINLDVATQMLVNSVERPPASQQPSSDGAPPVCSCQPRHKTKVRRLYDIANVLTSLGLIRKERYNNTPVRKPVFVYNGPSIDDDMMEPLDLNGAHTMRNSLLMVPVNEAKEFNAHNRFMRLTRKRKDESTYGPAEKHFCSSSEDSNDTKPARLGSLEDILRVAEQELKLLMSGVSEETSMSLPITCDGFDLSNVKQEPLVKEEPLSDDDAYSGPSSSFESCGSAMTNYSYESEPMPDLSVVKTEYPAEETEPLAVGRAASPVPDPVPETVLPVEDIAPVHPEAVPVEEAVSETVITSPTELPIASTVLPIAAGLPDESILPAGSTVLPAASAVPPAASTDVPAGSTVLPVGSAVLTAGSAVLPAGPTVLPAGSTVLPAGSAVIPAGSTVLPAGSTVLPAGSTVLPAGSAVLPAGSTVLPAGSAVLPAGSTVLPAGSAVLPAGSTVLPAGSTVFPAGTTVLPVGSTVLPVGSTVLPLAQLKLAEASPTEGKSGQPTEQMVNIKVVSSSGDVTYQKIPAFSCGSLASMQSGNDQLAIGKLKRFTVTRKLIPSHFVLQKDPSNNMKLTLHHAPNASNAANVPNVKGLIRLRPVASSPKLCLPVTCIKTLKTINVVKAAPPTAGVPRTVEIKKRLHLVPLNSGSPKGNISAVQ